MDHALYISDPIQFNQQAEHTSIKAHTNPNQIKSSGSQQNHFFQQHQPEDDEDEDLALSKIEQIGEEMESPPHVPNRLQNQFKLKELTKTAQEPNRKSKPYCGCGQYYSCTSSLYLHIRSKHHGVAPAGTIGGPKGIVKKPIKQSHQVLVKLQEGEPTNLQRNRPSGVNHNLQNQYNITKNDWQRQDQGLRACRICGKLYSCNSSLNLHIKRKHGNERRPFDGQKRQQDDKDRNFKCKTCNLTYGSKSALGLHINTKHNLGQYVTNKPMEINEDLIYEEERMQRCGCGLVYQSRSALNMHVKKKHNGVYPQGTTEKLNNRIRMDPPFLKKGQQENQTIERYLMRKQDDEPSIYDSDSDQVRNESRQKSKQLDMQRMDQQDTRPYKCGCGKLYSCSSSLNLHIKKHHNRTMPEGTIGGPRGLRAAEHPMFNNRTEPTGTRRNQQNIGEIVQGLANEFVSKVKVTIFCSKCRKNLSKQSHFVCVNCTNHQMCNGCFWKNDQFKEPHAWVARDENNNDQDR